MHVPRDPGVDVAHPVGRHKQGPRHGLPAHRARAGGQEKVRLFLRLQIEFAQRGKCGGSSGQGDPVEAHGASHRYRGKHTDLDPTDLAPQVLDARGAKVPADSEAVGSLPHKVSMSSEHNCSQCSPFSSGSDHERRTIQDFFLTSTKPHRKIQGGSIFDKFNPLYPIDHVASGDGQ